MDRPWSSKVTSSEDPREEKAARSRSFHPEMRRADIRHRRPICRVAGLEGRCRPSVSNPAVAPGGALALELVGARLGQTEGLELVVPRLDVGGESRRGLVEVFGAIGERTPIQGLTFAGGGVLRSIGDDSDSVFPGGGALPGLGRPEGERAIRADLP